VEVSALPMAEAGAAFSRAAINLLMVLAENASFMMAIAAAMSDEAGYTIKKSVEAEMVALEAQLLISRKKDLNAGMRFV